MIRHSAASSSVHAIRGPRDTLLDFLRSLRHQTRLLVAVSGGSDSTGLLVLLHKLLAAHAAEFPDISLSAVTVDHALRSESADEALRVAELCRSLAIPHEICRWDGAKPKTGIAAAAREARYRLLVEAATRLGATAILTGHTLDDQRETIAMRAARGGEDAAGLSGMAPCVLLHTQQYLLRPFLQTTRQAVRQELAAAGIGWIDDPSNEDRRYERVRVRGLLAGASAVSLGEMQRFQDERQVLSDRAAELLSHCLTIKDSVLGHLTRQAFDVDWPVLRYALRTLAAVLGGRDHLPPVKAVDRLQPIISSGNMFRTTMGRTLFHVNGGGLYIVREQRALPVVTVAAGETGVWDGRFRVANLGDLPVLIGPSNDPPSPSDERFSCPPSLAKVAASIRPQCVNGGSVVEEKMRIQPIIAPFDRFLPQFDRSLAEVIAVKIGLPPFPPDPFNALERKT